MIGIQSWRNILRFSYLYSVRNFKFIYSRWRNIGWVNLGLITAHCQKLTQLKKVETEHLSHEECIKQACMVATNSATTLLTTATSAVLDICNKYKKSLNVILGLYEELLLTRDGSSDIWERAVEFRVEMNQMKAALSELNTYMLSVEKVVNSTTEAAFLAGAEYLCTILCERLHSAQTEIARNINEIKKLEDDFLRLEKEVVKTVKNKDTEK